MEKKFYFIYKAGKFYDLRSRSFISDPCAATVSDRKKQMENVMKDEGLSGCKVICLTGEWNSKRGRYEYN